MNLSQIPKIGFCLPGWHVHQVVFQTIQHANEKLLTQPRPTSNKIKHVCEARLALFQPYIAHWPEVKRVKIDL
jgi:hypothetical protein